jgi:subtilisin family serine protease
MKCERINGVSSVLSVNTFRLVVLAVALAVTPPGLAARSGADNGVKRYLVALQDPPLALYDGRSLSAQAARGQRRLAATNRRQTGERRLNIHSQRSREYLQYLEARHEALELEAAVLLGRSLRPVHRYRMVANGLALDLTPEEAQKLSRSPMVRTVTEDRRHRLHTFAGPEWLGAAAIWDGEGMLPEKRGENVVVGVIDTGINWDHPSFANPSGGYSYSNPLGDELGLCQQGLATCNGKIIGVYDFVEDNPATDDIEEENTNGKDNDGHGSHVASTAAGNRLLVTLEGNIDTDLSGVAPRANIVSYRVCYVGVPPDPEGGGCLDSAIMQAIDQAVEDGVDIINFSIGTEAFDPWHFLTTARAFLAAREAGIFVATSAGNFGPGESSIGSPANAPWVTAVGYATHDSVLGNQLENLAGGNSPPPELIVGASLTQENSGVRRIVHARDFGHPLCGIGVTEDEGSCENLTGATNPWAGQQPFNGEIVVCDRGDYGRVEKGRNVLEAGAGGYILANTPDWGEAVVADKHCLPALHIGGHDGDRLRDWLATGDGHQGSFRGFRLVRGDLFADQVVRDSARGPSPQPAEDVMKPNLIAPGEAIWAAIETGDQLGRKSGSSMSSPHIAGAAALLKSVHPGWGPSEITSALETTATRAVATDQGLAPADAHVAGAGRPQLGEAARIGLFLDVTASQFAAANPVTGGDPKSLNLPGLVDASCAVECRFERTLTDLVGGANWSVTAVDFPAGVGVEIEPSAFSLSADASREIAVTVKLGSSLAIDEWLFGRIRLSSAGLPDQFLSVAVSYGFPATWVIEDDRDGGWKEFGLSGLAALPDATFTTGGLVRQEQTEQVLPQDLTRDDPYDGGEGVYTVLHELPEGGLWVYAETLESSAVDIDLFVGRDVNGNGRADASEELCSSTTPDRFERCDLFDVAPGNYWVLIQNWDDNGQNGDEVTLVSAAVGRSGGANLAASGPGITPAVEFFPVRVSWDNLNAAPGEVWLGAVGVGSSRSTPNDVGVVPVKFTRTGVAATKTFPLMAGSTHRLALDGNGGHDRVFIDVPPGTSSLSIFVNGETGDQNDQLAIELKRLDFDAALSSPPFAVSPAAAPVRVSAEGVGGEGPSITVLGVEPGRWYAVLSNRGAAPVSAEIRAELQFEGAAIVPQPGLWQPSSRPGLGQGFDFNRSGSFGALVWYSYDEAGQPTWYIANNPVANGNVWTAELLRFTNDGARQQFARVGQVSLTSLAENDVLFSYTLFGQSGTERMAPISLLTCPGVNGVPQSYTGLWYRGVDGLGGASVLVNAERQGQIHYLFDDRGVPRWLLAQDLADPAPANADIPLLQFHGFCAVCEPADVGFLEEPVGLLTRSFNGETEGSWTQDYLLAEPLQGSANRTEAIVKLTDRMDCQ